MEELFSTPEAEGKVIKRFHFGAKPDVEPSKPIKDDAERDDTGDEDNAPVVEPESDTEPNADEPTDQPDADHNQLIAELKELRLTEGDHALRKGEILATIKDTGDKELFKIAVKAAGVSERTANTLVRIWRAFHQNWKTFSIFGQEVLGLFASTSTPPPAKQEFLEHQTITNIPVKDLSFREVKEKIDELKVSGSDDDDDEENAEDTADTNRELSWEQSVAAAVGDAAEHLLMLQEILVERSSDEPVASMSGCITDMLADLHRSHERLVARLQADADEDESADIPGSASADDVDSQTNDSGVVPDSSDTAEGTQPDRAMCRAAELGKRAYRMGAVARKDRSGGARNKGRRTGGRQEQNGDEAAINNEGRP